MSVFQPEIQKNEIICADLNATKSHIGLKAVGMVGESWRTTEISQTELERHRKSNVRYPVRAVQRSRCSSETSGSGTKGGNLGTKGDERKGN